MITLTPSPCQTLMRMIEGIAQNGSVIQRWGGIPADAKELVEQAALGRVDPEPHQADGDGRGHQRQEVHGPDPRDAPDGLVQAHRDGQRHGHAQGHRDDRVEDGVAEGHPEPVVVGEVAEVVEPVERRRRQQVPRGEADAQGRQDGTRGQHRETDERGRQEQPRPLALARQRAAAALAGGCDRPWRQPRPATPAASLGLLGQDLVQLRQHALDGLPGRLEGSSKTLTLSSSWRASVHSL